MTKRGGKQKNGSCWIKGYIPLKRGSCDLLRIIANTTVHLRKYALTD